MSDALSKEELGRNVRIFVWFRVLFNARFYYPIFAVFFTDMGLTVGEFLWLNAIWAVTIVLFEVPSGVLADLVGRRRLVIFSALSMVVEMGLLIVAPVGGGMVLFSICAVNRVLSGVAEAAASGADEALAYDSLKERWDDDEKIEERWDDTLMSVMRWRSVGMVVAMLIGGFVFDHEQMTNLFGDFPRWVSLKLPIILCFVSACVCLFLSMRLVDLGGRSEREVTSVRSLGRGMLDAGAWVAGTRWIAALMVGAVMIDAVSRTFTTLMSEYFRSVDVPEFTYGMIGAAMSLGGMVVPMYVKPLTKRFGPRVNVLMAGGIGVLGLTGVALAGDWWGVFPCFLVMMSMVHVGFLMSRYINRDAPSEKRASILSVNSLTLNLGYGAFSGLFALRMSMTEGELGDEGSFVEALGLLPWCLGVGLVVWFLVGWVFGKKGV